MMYYTLERKIKTNPFYISIGFIIALFLFFLFGVLMNPQLEIINYKTEIVLFIVLLHLTIVFFLYIANRRFLKKIEFDFNKNILKTQSIIKSVIHECRIEEIKEIKLINSQGFGNITKGFRNQNLVIRINNKLQPQIFEIRDEDLSKMAEEIINKINNR